MKYIKDFNGFNINEQLFGNIPKKISNILGLTSELKDVKDSKISGKMRFNASGDKDKGIKALINAMERNNITNPYTQIAILCVIGKESNFIPQTEKSYSNTPNERIKKALPQLSNLDNKTLNDLKSDDEEFFNKAYGGIIGNSKSEGYKYRGRGFNQITGKSNYEAMNKLLNSSGNLDKSIDIVNNPDQLNDVDIAAEAAILFFLRGMSSKQMLEKYKTNEINGFTSQDIALKAITNINAGLGNTITDSSSSLLAAKKYLSDFKIDGLKKVDSNVA